MGGKNANSTGLGKAAKRRLRLYAMAARLDAESDAETASRYRNVADELTEKLRSAGACLRCGRILRDGSTEYGPECAAALAEEATHAESTTHD